MSVVFLVLLSVVCRTKPLFVASKNVFITNISCCLIDPFAFFCPAILLFPYLIKLFACLAKPIVTFVLEATVSTQQTFCCQAKCDVAKGHKWFVRKLCKVAQNLGLHLLLRTKKNRIREHLVRKNYSCCVLPTLSRSYRLGRLQNLYAVVNTKGN